VREQEFARAAAAAGAPIAIGSDAHYALQVGRFDTAVAAAEEIGITEDQLVNRDAASVLDFLTSKRERPRLDVGGVWEWPNGVAGPPPEGEV
jgi:histidinol phosphatase-like PHP family hydrolase